jgi:hypothetical protein
VKKKLCTLEGLAKRYITGFFLIILFAAECYASPLNISNGSPANPLNTTTLTEGLSIAAGEYYDGKNFHPLLAMTQDGGTTWSYPPAIYSSTTLPPYDFSSGRLYGVSCNEKLCIASGVYHYGKARPIVAISQDGGMTWLYPEAIYSTAFPDFLHSGAFMAASCTSNVCIAGGTSDKYDEKSGYYLRRPLLAVSQNGGTTWSYPEAIYSTALPNNFAYGDFVATSCSNKLCIAAGDYTDSLNSNYQRRPLLAVSQDNGSTWSYPATLYSSKTLPSSFWNLGEFFAASCSDKLCIASGHYVDDPIISDHFRPLLAMSQDGGATWSYPEAIYSNALPHSFQDGILKTASCSDKLCIASGFFYNKNSALARPLLAVSRDGGTTWSYPEAIYSSALPKHFSFGSLDGGANCNGNLCIATGYFHGDGKIRPLLAMSQDGGVTWSYPPAIYSSETLPSSFTEAELISARCKGKYCTASGHYYDGQNNRPLLAMTQDGGKTWSYPSAIYSSALPSFFANGDLDGGTGAGYATSGRAVTFNRTLFERSNANFYSLVTLHEVTTLP